MQILQTIPPINNRTGLSSGEDLRQQRIVIVGSGGFLSNTYSGNGGNIDLGLNIANWLTNQEKLIAITPRAAKDNTVTLSRTQLTAISALLIIVLPLLL